MKRTTNPERYLAHIHRPGVHPAVAQTLPVGVFCGWLGPPRAKSGRSALRNNRPYPPTHSSTLEHTHTHTHKTPSGRSGVTPRRCMCRCVVCLCARACERKSTRVFPEGNAMIECAHRFVSYYVQTRRYKRGQKVDNDDDERCSACKALVALFSGVSDTS